MNNFIVAHPNSFVRYITEDAAVAYAKRYSESPGSELCVYELVLVRRFATPKAVPPPPPLPPRHA